MIDTVERPPAASRSQPMPPAWTLRPAAPSGWMDALVKCRGAFFHTTSGVLRSAPGGVPFFGNLESEGGTMALTAGVWTGCRLSSRLRHVYLPTYPAIADPGLRDEAFGALVRVLHDAGAAELLLDSFDAAIPAPNAPAGTAQGEQIDRLEYVVGLDRDGVLTGDAFSEHHRRHLKRAERDGWKLQLPTGEEAAALLADVQTLAAARAARRGSPFAVPATWRAAGPGWPAECGEQVFAVHAGSKPLSAALVGWANRRVYSVSAGSTADGYAATSSVWLHWRIMRHFAAAGFASYNLGGAPSEAKDPQSPAHGLHRFKTGFAPDEVPCRTIRWVLRPAHEYAHVAARRARRWLAHREVVG